MGLTVKQVVEANNYLTLLIKADRENRIILSSATRMKLAGNLRPTKPVAEKYHEERAALFAKYGELNDKEEYVLRPSSPNREAFNKELRELLAVETEIVSFQKVSHKDLFGEVVKSKDGDKPENQIDLDVLAGLIEFGIIDP